MIDNSRKILISILRPFKKREYCPNEYYYEGILDKFGNLSSYLDIVNFRNGRNSLNTDSEISFLKNTQFEYTTYTQVIEKYGKPNYKIINNHLGLFKIHILIYKLKIGGHKVKLEMHFKNGKLFFYRYIFSYINDNIIKNEILPVIKDKYNIKNKIEFENDYINDTRGSSFFFTYNIDFSINYIYPIKQDAFVKSVLKHRINMLKKDRIKKKVLYNTL